MPFRPSARRRRVLSCRPPARRPVAVRNRLAALGAPPGPPDFLLPGFPPVTAAPRPRVVLTHRVTGAVHVGRFAGPQLVIGSGSAHLRVPDRSLAGRQAVVQLLHGGALCLAAVRGGLTRRGGSRNGVVLRPGGRVDVGDFELTLEDVLPEDPALGPPRSKYFASADPRVPPKPGAPGVRIVGPDGTAAVLSAAAPALLVGAGRVAGVRLRAGDAEPAHALMLWHDGGPWVVDLRSDAGTTVGGRPVRRRRVEVGDAVQFGGERVGVAALAGP